MHSKQAWNWLFISCNFHKEIFLLKRLKKIVYYFVVVVVAILFGGALGVYIYKDDIIDLLKEEVNKNLETELEVEKIDINFLKGFPNLAVAFKEVKFHSAFENEMLLTGDNVFFVLNVWGLLEQNIEIERLEIVNGNITIHKNRKGKNNFDVFTKSQASDTTKNSLEIHSIQLTNVSIKYIDEINAINTTYSVRQLLGSAKFQDPQIEFYVQSNFSLTNSSTKNINWLENKDLLITTRVVYDGEFLSVPPSQLSINKAHFEFNGFVQLTDIPQISIELSGRENDFSSLVSVLPEKMQRKLAPLNGKGKINFESKVEGKIANSGWPGLTASINLSNFEINHKQLKEQLHLKEVKTDVLIQDLKHPETGRFILHSLQGSVKQKSLTASGVVDDFENPGVHGTINGDLDLPWLFSLSNLELEKPVSGTLGIDASFSFNVAELKKPWGKKGIQLDATCDIKESGFYIKSYLPVENLNGEITWKNGVATFTDVKGLLGHSDISLNGHFSNTVFSADSLNNAKTTSSLDISSTHLYLDEIVDLLLQIPADSTTGKTTGYPEFKFDIKASLDSVDFRRFHGTDLHTRATVESNQINVEKLVSIGLGGKIALAGKITRQFNADYFILAKVNTKSIELDSLFYVFHNFWQDFITADYLKGQLNSDIFTYMYFDKNWRFRRNLLYSEAILQIKKGELNNFEPIMALAPYLNNQQEKLSRLKFSDLNSHVDIAKDTVFLSDMYVGTNVRNIKIGGYHTLDQHIDYRLSVPVINDKRDKDQEFGEVKTDKEGRLYWPFRIKGTTDDYKVNYDIGRAGSNLVKGLKRELSEFGNTLTGKKKELKKDTLLLEEDEYFDWDNE